ncbi:MAG: ABC transporter ATP-binding protein [Bacillota bacterium]|nr:ABC transporter ATP-binding protein [Bacillota bacterium]
MSKLNISHVFMNYHSLKGEMSALNDINFNVSEGEFVSIVGPSGCGKSTLLNIIAGLIKPSRGSVVINNEQIISFSNKMGYMFQKDHLFEWLTVKDNITLGLKIGHKLDKNSEKEIDDLLIKYNLIDFKDYFPNELSGGMRQRAALIRTLALKPEVLLLDEPFSALDYQTRLYVGNEIHQIIKEESKTAIMVTHDIAEAVAMSDRVMIMSKRPAYIKKDLIMEFPSNCCSALSRRDDSKFSYYFNLIWRELDLDENTKK